MISRITTSLTLHPRNRSLFRVCSSHKSSQKLSMYPSVIDDAVSKQELHISTHLTSEITKLYTDGKEVDLTLVNNQVENYYRPMYAYLQLLQEMKTKLRPSGPLLVGISAPQGCGKTTMTDMLRGLYAEQGLHAIAVSLDDFYLTGAEQDALAAANADNDLLHLRGNAGTHDLTLMMDTLKALQTHKANGGEVRLPRYDKSLRAGRGDRAPEEAWDVITEDRPVDVILFEGWMLGFAPYEALTDHVLTDICTHNTQKSPLTGSLPPGQKVVYSHQDQININAVNTHLKSYSDLHTMFDGWLVIALMDISYVYQWRLDAEKKMISSGKSGMSDNQVADFISRFMPAYQVYCPNLHTRGKGPAPRMLMPSHMDESFASCHESENASSVDSNRDQYLCPCPALMISIDENRLPVAAKFL